MHSCLLICLLSSQQSDGPRLRFDLLSVSLSAGCGYIITLTTPEQQTLDSHPATLLQGHRRKHSLLSLCVADSCWFRRWINTKSSKTKTRLGHKKKKRGLSPKSAREILRGGRPRICSEEMRLSAGKTYRCKNDEVCTSEKMLNWVITLQTSKTFWLLRYATSANKHFIPNYV